MMGPHGPHGRDYPHHSPYAQNAPPHGLPPYGPARYHPHPSQLGFSRSGLLKGGGAACALAGALLFVGFVLLGIGATNRRLREAKPLGAFVVLLSVVPALSGGGLLVAGALKRS